SRIEDSRRAHRLTDVQRRNRSPTGSKVRAAKTCRSIRHDITDDTKRGFERTKSSSEGAPVHARLHGGKETASESCATTVEGHARPRITAKRCRHKRDEVRSNGCPEAEIAHVHERATARGNDCDPPTDHHSCATSAYSRLRQLVALSLTISVISPAPSAAEEQEDEKDLRLRQPPLHSRGRGRGRSDATVPSGSSIQFGASIERKNSRYASALSAGRSSIGR